MLPLIAVAVLCAVLSAEAGESWTLERALRHALTNSPDARLAQQRVAAAQAGLEQAKAVFWPHVQLQSSYAGTDNPMLVFGSILNQRAFSPGLDFNRVPDVDNLNVKGLLTVPLYSGGQMSSGRAAAKAATHAARYESEAVRDALAFEVVRTFHTVLKARAFVEATEAAAQAFESDSGDCRKRRFDAGTLLRADVLDVEVRLAQAREDLVRARNALALSERTLRNLIGLEDAEFVVAGEAPPVSVPTASDAAERPEAAALRHRRSAAEAGLRGARGGYYPKLSAFGSVDYDRGGG